ncbi:hypothetical protein C477_10513 [Haloterrigena salina JCM 13891]|uniref:Uncharacterized protein n=1 Tax=Haloterrigena salina JCM 13891 TaxID=1227488 RepID=M0C841_9EURY|nr:hypothetical protein [Haloterrigena salina]ELZ18492.1 hypothetical protein C477_10513 [Haloterrigena salina JCM 13891]
MDWETPVDAWYVWLGASIVSLALAGVVLALPTGPPPDAEGATNAIEETTASSYEASSTLEHDADAIRIDGKTVALRNEHGVSRSSLAYGQVVAVNGDERLERLVYGESFATVFESELEDADANAATAFMDRVADADENTAGEWLTASDELTVRQVTVEPDELPEVRVHGTDHEDWILDGHRSLPKELAATYEGDETPTVTYTVTGTAPVEPRLVAPHESVAVGYEAEWTTTHTDSDTVRTDLDSHLVDGERIEGTRSSGTDTERPDEEFWIGVYPLTVTAEFGSETCETTLESATTADSVCPAVTATDERAAELDWIERNDETGNYHVTLAVV